ncbi:zinc-binding alcohol dehydrogenase family protein [Alicyclobacillus sp. SO9]|uniref:zinc-binding alcohol dehydrogenase family protein n=1 Tax=Alicyclobacillus sp. SO9 TaxID=2665646 RepID=UPI0018E8C8B2|nr:zinc-binding alcohol dehydrogenase family protein [Alicyclobacillus sp. SO9]QQE77884.1 zinc-binding alcohol dehydrogenase family protein [Alicyclobacillus sp. SO9]
MNLMKSVVLTPAGELVDSEIERPSVSGRDLLIRVQAVAVNPVDTIQQPNSAGPRVLGWDAAGEVVSVGADCTLFQPGDEVYYAGDITRKGANSEYHLVDERIVGRKPASLSFADAAALPLTSITAWEGMFHRIGIDPFDTNKGKTILIIGAAGGVGSIATQLANEAGLTVVGTASRQASSEWALEHGAHHVINHAEDFAPQLQELGIQQVDYAFCLNVVNENWDNMLNVVAPQGRVCTILPPMAPLDFRAMADKTITWSIEAMFARPKHQTEDMDEQHKLLNHLSTWIDQGKIKSTKNTLLSPISATNLQEAYRQLNSKRTIGKIVLEGFR